MKRTEGQLAQALPATMGKRKKAVKQEWKPKETSSAGQQPEKEDSMGDAMETGSVRPVA